MCAAKFERAPGGGCACQGARFLTQNGGNCVDDCYANDRNSVVGLTDDRCVADCASTDKGSILTLLDGVRRCVCNALAGFYRFDFVTGRCICKNWKTVDLTGSLCIDVCPKNEHNVDGHCECNEGSGLNEA